MSVPEPPPDPTPEPVPTPPGAIPLWFLYELSLVGTDVIFQVWWYRSDAVDAVPIWPDPELYKVPLTDPAVTPERVRREVYDRAEVIRQAITRGEALEAAFGAGAGVKVPVP